jgi:hypothetical protein
MKQSTNQARKNQILFSRENNVILTLSLYSLAADVEQEIIQRRWIGQRYLSFVNSPQCVYLGAVKIVSYILVRQSSSHHYVNDTTHGNLSVNVCSDRADSQRCESVKEHIKDYKTGLIRIYRVLRTINSLLQRWSLSTNRVELSLQWT